MDLLFLYHLAFLICCNNVFGISIYNYIWVVYNENY